MANLSDKTALVTGASRGIGRATAIALTDAGARVLVHYGKSQREADSLVENIRTNGGKAEAVGADLAAPEAASELAAKVRSLIEHRLDIVVANAGISKAARIEDHTIAEFDSLFATNVRVPFFLVQQLLPLLGEGSSVGFPWRYEGREKVEAFFKFVRELYPDLNFHDVKIVCETPDVVVGEYEFTTKSSKTGRLIHQLFVGRLEAENGQIKLLRESINLVELGLAIYTNGLTDYKAAPKRQN